MILLQNASSKKAALEGSMLVIDPSSGGKSRAGERSVAGYALFEAAQLIESGILEFPEEDSVYMRQRNVFSVLMSWSLNQQKYDLLVVEEIRGAKAQSSLIESCGVYIVGIDSSEFFRPNVSCWKAVARHWGGYTKSDENDAIFMGYATICIALGWASKMKAEKKEEIIKKAKELTGYE